MSFPEFVHCRANAVAAAGRVTAVRNAGAGAGASAGASAGAGVADGAEPP